MKKAITHETPKHKKKSANLTTNRLFFGGPDGTRTRDPMRDRHVF